MSEALRSAETTGAGQSSDAKRVVAHLLKSLYGDEAAGPLLERLWAMLPSRGGSPRPARNDCMLITYANSIVAADATPLATLGWFLDEHLGDTFGRVHVLPFFPSSSDDGFSVIDYRMVDHRLGSWAEIEALGQRYDLMVDLVINHCSRESLWFADFVSGRQPGRHYFLTLLEGADVTAVARPRSTPLITAVHTYSGIRHVWNTFSSDQIDLDFSNPDVLCEFVDILLFYIARGARLIRLDAVGYLWKRLGTSCLNLPETHAVVKLLRAIVDASGTGAKLVTETNVPHAENVAYFGRGDEAHIVYQFSLAPLLLYSFVFGDSSYLVRWALDLEPPRPGTTFLNFLASHDGIGLRPLEGLVPEAEVDRLVAAMHERGGFVATREIAGTAQRPYEINISLLSALGGEDGVDAYLAAHAMLLSFQGSPAIYVHSLLGTLNDLDLVEQTGRTRSINRRIWAREDLEAALADAGSLHARVLAGLKRLVARRNATPALRPDVPQQVVDVGPGAVALERDGAEQRLLVVGSVCDSSQQLPAQSLGITPGEYRDCLSGTLRGIGDALELGPYEVLWLER